MPHSCDVMIYATPCHAMPYRPMAKLSPGCLAFASLSLTLSLSSPPPLLLLEGAV